MPPSSTAAPSEKRTSTPVPPAKPMPKRRPRIGIATSAMAMIVSDTPSAIFHLPRKSKWVPGGMISNGIASP
jgi:hypothetical protein